MIVLATMTKFDSAKDDRNKIWMCLSCGAKFGTPKKIKRGLAIPFALCALRHFRKRRSIIWQDFSLVEIFVGIFLFGFLFELKRAAIAERFWQCRGFVAQIS
ncbi:MAG: hypothetical protein ACI9IV_001706 [Paracoccaceae bacterium]|jgi:hypothetical protein